jgi:hypothetical protein
MDTSSSETLSGAGLAPSRPDPPAEIGNQRVDSLLPVAGKQVGRPTLNAMDKKCPPSERHEAGSSLHGGQRLQVHPSDGRCF